MKKTTFLLLLFFIANQASAKIKLPNILGDNMVLQQQTNVKLWGEAQPNKKVTITPTWNKKKYSTTSDSKGKWLLHLETPKAGGPYKIIISDGETVELNNVLLGEVWFCSGQSNMTMPLNGYAYQPTQNSLNTIPLANAKTPIRMCTIGRASSKIPLEQCVANWRENTPGAVAVTSATAYFFAQMIEKSLEVPVGIIVSSWGGSSIETWMSSQSLAAFPEFDLSFLSLSTPVEEPVNKKPSLLFNAMIYPIHNYTIRGMLWYQGEANIAKPSQYELLQPAFVKAMRELWAQGDFPFYYVQIAPYGSSNKINTAMLREAQLRNLKTISNSGMAVTMDIGEELCIHPPRKQEVGERLAYLALSKTYKLDGYSCRTPVYKSMKIEGGKAYLSFDDCEMNVAPLNVPLTDFEIAGEDRIFYPAQAIIQKGKGLTVSASEVPNPVAVRYGFKNWVKGSLFDTSGLPVSSFRTDNW